MKTNNLTKLVKGVLATAALITTVVACGNKNGDNPNLNAYQQSCTNCQNISGFPFFTTQSTGQSLTGYGSSQALKLNWSFSGQNLNGAQSQQNNNNNNNGNYYNYSAPSMQYNGQVSAIGSLTVNVPLNLGMCPQLPAGAYNMATQTVGTWNGNGYQAQVAGLRLVMTKDSYTFTAVLSNAYAVEYPYSYTSSTRVSGNLQIEQVNGYYCQSANFYLY